MDRVEQWVTGYRRAWESNDPDDVRALFTEDAEYRMTPSSEPLLGHDAIVAGWLEHQDPPGSTEWSWEPVAEDGDTAVVRCLTVYPDGAKRGTYDNLWVLRFGVDGRVRSFTDWWIARR